jgi:Protein of unknown function (DUF2934)
MQEVTNTIEPRLPTPEEIAGRAYQIYMERGCEPGHDIDDWLQAEYELMQLPTQKIADLELAVSKKGKGRTSALVSLVRAAILLGGAGLAQLKR